MMDNGSTHSSELSPPYEATERLLDLAIEEDQVTEDVTTRQFTGSESSGTGTVIARENGVLAGRFVLPLLFDRLPGSIRIEAESDGTIFSSGESIIELSGPIRTLLSAERVMLNFLQRLSGIASFTRQFVQQVDHQNVDILDTRKTTPGWRALEKYAVRAGGGKNHRMNLAEQALIKENHLKLLEGQPNRSLRDVVQQLTQTGPVEIEVSNQNELNEALNAEPDMILLDNMSVEETARAVEVIRAHEHSKNESIRIEASGEIDLDTVRNYADTGVDRISVGRITHSAPAIDLSMILSEDGIS